MSKTDTRLQKNYLCWEKKKKKKKKKKKQEYHTIFFIHLTSISRLFQLI